MILVTGCTGFVGSHLVRTLSEHGLEVRCLARGTRGIESLLKGNVTFIPGDVTKPDSLRDAAEGVDTVIHLVGIIREHGEVTYQRVHVEGTRNMIEAAKAKGVSRFIYMSALGAKENGLTGYETTKWQAEQLVKASGMEWIITRPSLLIGKDGDFVKTLEDLAKKYPFVPVIGTGTYRLQPLYLGDLIQVFIKMLGDSKYWGMIYEFGGPEKLTFNEMIKTTCQVLDVRKPIVHMPLPIMRPMVGLMESVLPNPPVTSDQLAMLAEDNVTDHNAFTETFNIQPTPFREALRMSI